MSLRGKKLEYKWVILVVCFLMEFICLGFGSSTSGLYTVAVTDALHINRTVYSLSGSIRYITQVVVALFFGTFVNRLGTKKMVCIGLCSMLGCTLLKACATNVYHFYIAGAMLGLGMIFVGGTMASTILRRWFAQDVGRYTGIVMSANGIGGAIASQIVSPIINNGEVFGYRKSYLLSTLIILSISIVIVIFLKDRPAEGPVINTLPGKKQPKGNVWAGLEYTEIKKKPYFYLSALLVFLTGISLQSIGSISIVYMSDLGMSAGFIATTSTVACIVLTFGKILVGRNFDKKGLRFALLMCQGAAIIAFFLKGIMTGSTLGMVFAMAATILATLAQPIETVMIPLLTADMFGSASYAKVLGVFTAMNSLGLCLGTPLGNASFDVFGSYKPSFWLFFVLMVVVTISFQLVLNAAYKDKQRIMESVQQ